MIIRDPTIRLIDFKFLQKIKQGYFLIKKPLCHLSNRWISYNIQTSFSDPQYEDQ
jgi:hypothetical protein